ncbi:MAG: sterol desaturase family protein [Candidatus Pelagadaptatus aseana]|uniref:sterol desaturase family protein n=1 Tax=Candidatus Pelagadaptatus aseana TaxID=3120508 RepID=UPI0039B2400F
MSIVIYAIPLYLILIFIEFMVDRARHTGYYRINDAFGSLSLGIMSRSSKLVLIGAGTVFIDKLLPEARLWQLSADSVWVWLFTFVAYDFTYYWLHRISHSINFFWAGHVVHHSSEEYNLTTALRQTSSDVGVWLFSVPLLLTGVPVEVYLTCVGLNLIYQFWVHTRLIDKLWPWYEAVMVTPSHHRVHHAQNAVYIDRNHGGVFILWDKWFGTFQAELADEDIIYGVRRPLHSFNPLWANVQVWWSLMQDAWHTRRWRDKLRLWWMPTGWRPADVEVRYPLLKSDLSAFTKYDPDVDRPVQIYGMAQLTMNIGLLVYFLFYFAGLDSALLLSGFALISLPLITTGWLFEGRSHWWEGARLLLSWVLLVMASALIPQTAVWVFGGYLILSSLFYTGLFLLGTTGVTRASAG